MDRIKKHEDIVKQLLSEHAQIPRSDGQIEMQTVFDDQQRRYQLMAIGWQGKRRVHGCVMHIDIIDNKIWLQHNSTDIEIGELLTDMGVAKEHIVIGFLPEFYRQHGEYAVN